MCFCSVLRPVNAFSLTNDSEYIPLSFPCSCLRHIQLGTGPIPNAPIKKNSPKNVIQRSSSASDNAKACLHGLPLAFLHIPLHSKAIKPTMQNNGKTTPAKVKIIVSARHCILSIKRRKITITAVTPKILKTFLHSRLRCSLATFRTCLLYTSKTRAGPAVCRHACAGRGIFCAPWQHRRPADLCGRAGRCRYPDGHGGRQAGKPDDISGHFTGRRAAARAGRPRP